MKLLMFNEHVGRKSLSRNIVNPNAFISKRSMDL